MAKSRNRESWSIDLKPVGPRRPAAAVPSRPDRPAPDTTTALENILSDLFDAVTTMQKSLDEINGRLEAVEEKITLLQAAPRRAPREARERPIVATEAITRATNRPRPARRHAAEPSDIEPGTPPAAI